MNIAEILGTKYQDFLEFCSNWGKTYPDELSVSDFVAFRVQYSRNREYIEEIKSLLKEGKPADDCSNESGLGTIEDLDAPSSLFAEHSSEQLANLDDGLCSAQEENVSHLMVESVDTDSVVTAEREIQSTKDDICIDVQDEFNQEQLLGVYNVNVPLYSVLDVEIRDPLYRISIDELPVSIKIRRILKNIGIVKISDALNSTISKMFIGGAISDNEVKNTLRALKDFASQDYYCIKYFMMQLEYPLASIFEMTSTSQYENVSIESVDFSARFGNALLAHKIKSIQEILMLSINEMFGWKNLGRASIEDNINELYKFVCDKDKKIIYVKGFANTDNNNIIMVRMLKLVKSEQKPDLSKLSEQEIQTYMLIKNAIDDCGREFYDAVSTNTQYFKVIAQSLNQFAEEQLEIIKKENEIDTVVQNISDEVLCSSAKLMSNAYYMMHHNSINQFWDSIPEECSVKDLIGEIHSKLKTAVELSHICNFLKWLKNLDLGLILDDIFFRDALVSGNNKVDESYKDKYLYVIELRADGETLESIGTRIGSTRERVRQIERRFTHVFADRHKNNAYDVLAIIHALRGGDRVLTYDEVSELIGDRFTKLLWLLLSKGLLDNNTYRYSKKYNSVIFTTNVECETEKMEAAFEAMPEFFLVDQYDSIVDSTVESNDLQRELFEMFIEDRYQLNGIVYSKHIPTVIFMVGYVLKERFINGYKIADSEESSRFREYMFEFFGDRGKKSARAIDAVVGEIGVLVDRGKYVHTDYVNVDQWIIDTINEYVEANTKNVIPFSEVFIALKDVLAGTIITNRYIMQGVIKKYGSPFTLARDYITKERGKSLTDEFEDFAREIGEFTKEDFFASFPALNETNLAMLIGRCKNVFNIDNGIYMHSSLLKINEADYVDIRQYLLQACADNPVSSRTLFDEFSYRFIDFMDRNDIENHGKLFGVLYYMFADEFNFSRPYVAKSGTGQITNKSALMGYIGDVDSISIEEAIDICTTNGVHFYSAWNVMHMLSPEYIRISKDKLLKFSLTGIDNEVIDKVINNINEGLASKGYLSSILINDFLFYPQINISWNPYLVEAIVDYTDNRVGCINVPMTSYEMCTHIFVSKEYIGMNYQQFILELLDEAFLRGCFTDKHEMREWLCDRGLITTNGLPKFLEDNKFYFLDDNGHLNRTNAKSI